MKIVDSGRGLAGVLLGCCVLVSTAAMPDSPASRSEVTESDQARPDGNCEAIAMAPTEQREGHVSVVTRPEMTRYDIIPARLEATTRKVETHEALTVLTATDPVLETIEKQMQLQPSTTRWVRDSLHGTIPLSDGERADIEASGVALDEVTPGLCVREFHVPPVLGERQHRVLVRKASESFVINDAKLRQDTETLTVVPQHRRLIEVPPVIRDTDSRLRVRFPASARTLAAGLSAVAYHSVRQPAVETPAMITEVVEPATTIDIDVWRVDKPAYAESVVLPARFETRAESYEEVESRFSWQLDSAAAAGSNPAPARSVAGATTDAPEKLPSSAYPTRRVACLRQVPAVEHRYGFTRVVTPASVTSRVEQAQHRIVDVQQVQADARAEARQLPEQRQTRQVDVDLPPKALGLRPVVCEADVDRELVRQVQSALQQSGYDPGAIDGLLGPATLAALAEYEATHDLGITGQFAIPSLQRLGVRAALASTD